jgi:hypothetical protein
VIVLLKGYWDHPLPVSLLPGHHEGHCFASPFTAHHDVLLHNRPKAVDPVNHGLKP